jgi:cytochrome d ubiquinol oxidase subunit II
MLAYVPAALMLAGIAAYTVLAGADFGAGLWTLLPIPGRASVTATRDHARHAMGPVWEANHVWLIFVLVVCWTSYPVAFASIVSTLAAPLLIAAIGIVFRGSAYALRGLGGRVELLFALASLLTPFALGTVVGAVATGRVPVGNARGGLVSSWLAPAPVVIGVGAVAFSGYLAAVYLAADARRLSERPLESDFRSRALVAGLVSGGLALAGLFALRPSVNLLHGSALAMVIVSGCAGVATMVLCWSRWFSLARLTAALAVAAVVIGWALEQTPRFLPGLTVTQAAAGRSTLIAVIIAVCCGSVVLLPSLALLFGLFLRGRLVEAAAYEAAPSEAVAPGAPRPGGAPSGGVPSGAARSGAARGRAAGAFAAACLIAGAGLLVFADAAWAHALGVACFVACAVITFGLAVERG